MDESHKMSESPPRQPNLPAAEEIYGFPVSIGQQRFLDLDRRRPGNPIYNVAVRFQLDGCLDTAILRRALNHILDRHEVLRTSFGLANGEATQFVAPTLQLDVSLIDLRSLPPSQRSAEQERLSQVEARKPFDLSKAPLLRAALLQVADDRHVLLLTAHHTVCDGWSVGLISNEVGAIYETFSKGLPCPLAPLPLQFADFTLWQREWLNDTSFEQQRQQWLTQLGGLALLNLRTDRSAKLDDGSEGAIHSFVLPRPLTDGLRDLAARHGTTLFVISLAALKALLSRYCGQSDIALGTQVAGRDRVELESLIGLFINTLVLRTDTSADPTFSELVERVKATVSHALANRELPFERLLEELCPAADPDASHLFRVNFLLQRDFVRPLEFSGITLTALPSKSQGALYDLNFFMVERPDGWRASCEYKKALFNETTAVAMLGDFRAILESVVAGPNRRLSEFQLPSQAIGEHDRPGEQHPVGIRQLAAPRPIAASGDEKKGEIEVPAAEKKYMFAATAAQKRFWTLDQLRPGDSSLHMPIGQRADGPLETDILEKSLNEMVRRHEALRTSFELVDDELKQVITSEGSLTLEVIDLESIPEAERESAAQERLCEQARLPFDLSRSPLVRAAVIRLDAQRHLVVLVLHHVICDGWSAGLLARELWQVYQAFLDGRPTPLPELPLQYADYATWQHDWLGSEAAQEQLAFWRKQLSGRLPVLDFPLDRPPKPEGTSAGAVQWLHLAPAFVTSLKDLCKRQGTTMFMLCLAVFKTLLYRYTGQTDVLVGTPIANRRSETEGVMGLFSNPVCLRSNLSGNPKFLDLLEQVRNGTFDALTHKDLPFERIVDELEARRDRGRNPLFQFYFVYQVAFLQAIKLPELVLSPLNPIDLGTGFELHLSLIEREGALRAQIQYNSDLFDAATVVRILGHFRNLLEAVITEPRSRLSELALFSKEERRRLLPGLAAPLPLPDSPRPGRFDELFAAKARQTPDAPAIALATAAMSYRELDRRASLVANHLRSLGMESGFKVGLSLDWSAEMVAGFLGILRAGGACVILSPGAAEAALDSILAESKLVAVLTEQKLANWFKARGIATVCLDAAEASERQEDEAGTAPIGVPEDPACIFYGSYHTRNPVGVILSHHALARQACGCARKLGLGPDDKICSLHPSASQLAWEDIFAALSAGAAVWIPPSVHQTSGLSGDPLSWTREGQLTVLSLPGYKLGNVIELLARYQTANLRSLRLVLFSGAAIAGSVLAKWQRVAGDRVGLWKRFGVAAITGTAALHAVDVAVACAAPDFCVGDAIEGSSLYVLDSNLQLVPTGAIGELCIGGEILGFTDAGDGKPAGERLASNPFDGGRSRLVRLGERARYRSDGTIEYLGSDYQRGTDDFAPKHAGEIEAWLRCCPGVRDALVRQYQNPRGEQMVGYVVTEPRHRHDESKTREFLRDKLPQSDLPGAFVCLQDFPRTRDAEIDFAAMPAPAAPAQRDRGEIRAPQDDVEVKLKSIWERLLGKPDIGLHDDFFELGGNSLLAVRLFGQIEKAFQRRIPLATLIQAPTIGHLAEMLRDKAHCSTSCLVPVQPGGTRAPLFCLHGHGGEIFYCRNLSESLGPGQPLYGLRSRGLYGEPTQHSVEEMAAHYVEVVRTAQKDGPYYLSGFCFGGLIAYEMARLLTAQGQKVALLGLFNTAAPGTSHGWAVYQNYLRKRIVHELRKVRSLRFRQKTRLLGTDMFRFTGLTFGSFKSALWRIFTKFSLPGPTRWERVLLSVQDANRAAARAYRGGAYAGKVTLFLTREIPSYYLTDPRQGWRSYAAEVECHDAGGDNQSLFEAPFVQSLAEQLKECIERASGRGDKSLGGGPNGASYLFPAGGQSHSDSLGTMPRSGIHVSAA